MSVLSQSVPEVAASKSASLPGWGKVRYTDSEDVSQFGTAGPQSHVLGGSWQHNDNERSLPLSVCICTWYIFMEQMEVKCVQS